MTTKSNRRAWAIGLSVFAAVLAAAVALDVFGPPAPATKTDAATPPRSPAPQSCRQQVTSWKASAAGTYFRQAKAAAARVARMARTHQGAALRPEGAALAAAVRGAAAHPLPSCLDTPGYYHTAMSGLSAAARAAAHGRGNAALRWVRAARQPMARAADELPPAHRQHQHAAARPAPTSRPSAAATSGSSTAARGCFPRSHEGTCYEPGEYCRSADQGVAGLAGDGRTIVCEDHNGLRWEPTG